MSGVKHNHLSFDEFCNIEPVKYWRQQLSEANIKNVRNESQLGGTKNAYTYGLLRFHNWLCNKKFQYTVMTQTGRNTIRCHNITIQLRGVDHLLELSMNAYYKADFVRLIKAYLAEATSTGKPSIVKNSIYSIRSFFRENESDLTFHFNHRMKRSAQNYRTISMSLKDLCKILTVENIQPIERAVFLCKFQRGLDSSTLVDRFNFNIWEELVKHFGSTNPQEWDVQYTPVPIRLVRVKTGFSHIGFLDVDAITAIIEYLDTRHDKPEAGRALFVNKNKMPITVNWISRRFHKLVIKSGLQNASEPNNLNAYTPHEMRDLLKSTLIDSNCRPDVADHVIGHASKDSYEKQTVLYPESLTYEFAKASARINILSGHFKPQKSDTRHKNSTRMQQVGNPNSLENLEKISKQIITLGKRVSHLEQYIIK